MTPDEWEMRRFVSLRQINGSSATNRRRFACLALCCVLGTAHPTTTIASVLSSAAFPADNNDLDDLANIGKIVRSAPKESVLWLGNPTIGMRRAVEQSSMGHDECPQL